MNLGTKILTELDHGTQATKLKKDYPWPALSIRDRERLFAEAEKRLQDPSGRDLLIALYVMSRGSDLWDTLRVLGLVLRHPHIDLDKKHNVLSEMRGHLDKLRNSLSGSPGEARTVRRYQEYEARFHVLSAQVQIESNQMDEALAAYQAALAIGQKAGLQDVVTLVQGQMTQLEEIRYRDTPLVPLEGLESKRLSLQSELKRLETMRQEQETATRDLQAKAQQHKLEKDKLVQEVDRWRRVVEAGEARAREVEQRNQDLESRMRAQDAGLKFLAALPRVAMAPLWVEVLRLALRQGEMDDLSSQALERLSISCSQDALPILAEVAARWPAPYQVDPDKFRGTTAHWMALIAKARELKQRDMMAAAQAMVEAWDTFFASVNGNGENA